MEQDFQYDVFLSHSAKDKAAVRPLAEWLRTCRAGVAWRTRKDGLNPKAECGRQKAETLHSAFILHAFLNGSPAQHLCCNWSKEGVVELSSN